MLMLANLDDAVRSFMLEEVDADIRAGKLYLSPRLNTHGLAKYPELLKEAIRSHTDDWLANALRERCFNETESRRTKNGTTQVRVPVTAADTLAEGEFNRYYARGVCLKAIANQIPSLTVYRAKEVTNPRPESEQMIGRQIDPVALLDDLRAHTGIDTALHLPPGPNSGLSVRITA